MQDVRQGRKRTLKRNELSESRGKSWATGSWTPLVPEFRGNLSSLHICTALLYSRIPLERFTLTFLNCLFHTSDSLTSYDVQCTHALQSDLRLFFSHTAEDLPTSPITPETLDLRSTRTDGIKCQESPQLMMSVCLQHEVQTHYNEPWKRHVELGIRSAIVKV
jgi:hypothetical protein